MGLAQARWIVQRCIWGVGAGQLHRKLNHSRISVENVLCRPVCFRYLMISPMSHVNLSTMGLPWVFSTASHSQPLAFLQVQKEVKGLHDELAVVKAQAVAQRPPGSSGDPQKKSHGMG